MRYDFRFLFIILGIVYAVPGIAQINQPVESFIPNPPALPTSKPTPPLYSIGGNSFNYVRTWTPRKPMTSIANPWDPKVAMGTTYTSGFGKPIQSIKHGAVTLPDIVKIHNLIPSRTKYDFLPYADFYRRTVFRSDGYTAQENYNNSVFSNELGYNYTKTSEGIDNGVIYSHQYSAGRSFSGADIGSTVNLTIYDGIADDRVYIWKTTNPSDNPQIIDTYKRFELTIEHNTASQHAPYTKVYKDKRGRIVCKKVSDGTQWLSTYYLYDEMDKIRWIIPPKASPNTTSFPHTLTNDQAVNLCYYYKYDRFGMIVEKRVPDLGGTIEQYVYDRFHRLVMFQNGILAQEKKWEFTVYDEKDRIAFVGLFTDTSAGQWRAFWQARVLETSGWGSPNSAYQAIFEYLRNGIKVGNLVFTNFPNCQVNKYYFYDDESQLPLPLQGKNFVGFITDYLQSQETIIPFPTSYTDDLLVATQTRVMEPGNKWIYEKYFYDIDGRLIQTQSINPWNTNNTMDFHTIQYDFRGKTVLEINSHRGWTGTDKGQVKVCTKYNYNYSTGELQDVRQKIDQHPWLPIATYTYDDMSRVKKKELGNVEAQQYSYNIRGQLTGINEDYVYDNTKDFKRTFGEKICYDFGFMLKRFDGKATGYIYRGAGTGSLPRAYGYTYDRMGRMTMGDFHQRKDPLDLPPTWHKRVDYTADNISYDKNGNMLSLRQKGMALSGVVNIDRLKYNYHANSNRLHSIDDTVLTNYNLHDFLDRNVESQDYTYDANGNLKQDLNKNINSITYNYKNLPTSIQTTSGTITKLYDADGELLQKIVSDGGSSDTERYWGAYVYKNSNLQYILNREGRSRYNHPQNDFQNDFFVKDHLGNVRSVVQSEVTWGRPDFFEATWEVIMATVEAQTWDMINPIRNTKPLGTPQNLMSGLLNGGNPNARIGSAMLLHGMAGDRFEMGGYGYYEQEGPFDNYPMSHFMLESLTNSLVAGGGELGEGGPINSTISNLLTTGNYNAYDAIKHNVTDPTYPRMYMNYLVFDESFNLLENDTKVEQIKGTPNSWIHVGNPGDIVLPQNGYVLVYASNESSIPVWIDNVYVAHYKGVLLEENHYYPHGLTINVASSGTQPENEFLHQGKKLERTFGVELYDFQARQYDPQIGRFWGVDPMDQFPSGYTGMGNDPANMIDPTGMLAEPVAPDLANGNKDVHNDFVANSYNDRSLYDEMVQEEENAQGQNSSFENAPKQEESSASVDSDKDDWVQTSTGEIKYDENVTSQNDPNLKKGEKYLGKAVIVFDGSEDETLGEGNNLLGKNAKLAKVTVYGPGGEKDIKNYDGYTMSSNPTKFGAIAPGTYRFNYDAAGKSGALKSNWAVEGRGPVPARGGYNPNPNFNGSDRSKKTGIFIHTSNRNGFAGSYNNGKNGISEGCLLIVPTQWSNFNSQLQGVKQGTLQLNR